MADKAITDLNTIPGSIDDNNTWFAVAQSGTAYKVSGHEFVLAMEGIWQAHGGIKSIVYTPPVSPSLTGTLAITMADNSVSSFSIENGKGISSISKTGTSGLVDTYRISYNDGTSSTFTVTNGAKGDTGDSWYVWIRYAGQQPTSDSDIGTVPDDWIGIYSGTASTAPTSYTAYSWYEYKGEKGDTGDPSTLSTSDIGYLWGTSPSQAPEGTWSPTPPQRLEGQNYLWTRVRITFNTGDPITFYSVGHYGENGTGAVSTVNNIDPINGNVNLLASDIPTSDTQSIQAHITAAETDIDDLQADMTTAQGDITALNAFKDTAIMMPQNTIPIPASGSSVTITMAGLTSVHRIVYWNFSSSAENEPPVDLSWTTGTNVCTITNNGGTTSESMKPIFAQPQIIAATTT